MSATQLQKFGYADDHATATQHVNPKYIEHTLTNDAAILEKYYDDWQLCPNPGKTEVSFFHLNNRAAAQELEVKFCGKTVKFNKNPTYLGFTMDRTLTHKANMEKVAQKLKTRNNILQKLAGTNWGSNAETLRTAALALVFPTAEYCCLDWLRSAHADKVDIQINNTLRIVTGTLQSTPLPWLPVLANIEPSNIRRERALKNEWRKIQANDDLPIHQTLQRAPATSRIKSRKPLWKEPLYEMMDYDAKHQWREEWNSAMVKNKELIADPSTKVPGMRVSRSIWCKINRIRTGHGRSGSTLFKWNMKSTPN